MQIVWKNICLGCPSAPLKDLQEDIHKQKKVIQLCQAALCNKRPA
jgi:hypothetical protein